SIGIAVTWRLAKGKLDRGGAGLEVEPVRQRGIGGERTAAWRPGQRRDSDRPALLRMIGIGGPDLTQRPLLAEDLALVPPVGHLVASHRADDTAERARDQQAGAGFHAGQCAATHTGRRTAPAGYVLDGKALDPRLRGSVVALSAQAGRIQSS